MAVTLIARLGSLLRMSLDGNQQERGHTALYKWTFLERYVEIQRARFSDRLSVDDLRRGGRPGGGRPVAAAPADRRERDPPRSGPEGRAWGGSRFVGRIESGFLHLEVSGRWSRDAKTTAGCTEGTGLTNTRERLAKTYGGPGPYVAQQPCNRPADYQWR
jgi:hypothetical protein